MKQKLQVLALSKEALGKTYYLIQSNPTRMDWPVAKTLTDSYDGAQMFVPFNREMDKAIYDALKSMETNWLLSTWGFVRVRGRRMTVVLTRDHCN